MLFGNLHGGRIRQQVAEMRRAAPGNQQVSRGLRPVRRQTKPARHLSGRAAAELGVMNTRAFRTYIEKRLKELIEVSKKIRTSFVK